MPKAILTLILSTQLLLSSPQHQLSKLSPNPSAAPQPDRLWWGLIDPEMSLWFSHLPLEEEADAPILWDWSWRGFLAALFGQPVMKEAIPDAPRA